MEFHKFVETFGSGLFMTLGIVATFLAGVFVTRWLLFPFAVFGIRNRLDRMVSQMAEMKNQLQQITNVLDPDGTKARLHEQYANSLADYRTAECPHCHQKVSLKHAPAGTRQECPSCKKGIEILT